MPEGDGAEKTEPPGYALAVAETAPGSAPAGYLEALHFCLERRGQSLSPTLLMGLTGESFRLFFDPRRPLHGLSVLTHNPLRAAGGTLGILIPPSLALIIYGIIANVSIGSLFIAPVAPGILLV